VGEGRGPRYRGQQAEFIPISENEAGSEKYTAYVMQLSGAIVAAMPIEIARKHGLSNARTEAELVASAIKECSEAHQAKLLGAPFKSLKKRFVKRQSLYSTCYLLTRRDHYWRASAP
jgi:hypothetical protein